MCKQPGSFYDSLQMRIDGLVGLMEVSLWCTRAVSGDIITFKNAKKKKPGKQPPHSCTVSMAMERYTLMCQIGQIKTLNW